MRILKKLISTALAAALIVSAAMPSYAGGFVRAGDGAISMGGNIYRLDQTTGMTTYSLLNAAQDNFRTHRWEQPALSDGRYYLTYRFAGIGITGVSSRTAGGLAAGGTAEAITNPHFTSDSISASGLRRATPSLPTRAAPRILS